MNAEEPEKTIRAAYHAYQERVRATAVPAEDMDGLLAWVEVA